MGLLDRKYPINGYALKYDWNDCYKQLTLTHDNEADLDMTGCQIMYY